MASALSASAAPRVIEIPALSFGKNRWSVVKMTNSSELARTVTIEVYRQNGDKLPLAGEVNLKPRETKELRVEAETERPREMCWARITDPSGESGLEATGVLEILRGDTIESFERPPHQPSRNTRWMTPSWSVQNKDLYFLNASDRLVEVSFCMSDRRTTTACPKRATHYPVPPKQSIMLAVGKLRQQYFLTESSAPGQAVLVLMIPAAGDRKVFSSDSSIQFGETPER